MAVSRPLSRRGRAATASLADGDVTLDIVGVNPDPVESGGSVAVEVRASNAKLLVGGSGNPDCCGSACGLPGSYAVNGYSYVVEVEIEGGGSFTTNQSCLGTTELGTFDNFHTLEVGAPSVSAEGQYTITATIRFTGSGDEASTSRDMIVAPPGNGDNGGGPGNGGNGGNGGAELPFGLTEQQLLLGGAALTVGGVVLIAQRRQSPGRRSQSRSRQGRSQRRTY